MQEPLDEIVASLLLRHGFVQQPSGAWEFQAEVETHRTLLLRLEPSAPDPTYVLEAQEFRGGEGYEDDVLQTTSVAKLEAVLAHWVPWASEPFTMTRWRRFLSRMGLHWLY